MAKIFTSNTSNITSEFICVNCGFKCDKKGDFNRHILTAKHKRLNPTNEITSNTSNFTSHECPCGKKYKHQSSLLKHKKTCTFIENDNKSVIGSVSEETIMNLIQENKDIKQMLYAQNETTNKLIDIIPKVNNNTTNNNNTINNNQKFNINIFLNEKCKDAIDIKEFISQIQLTLENLDFSRTQGLEAGLTSVIIENMNKLSLYERPIHCTDTKRETLYIKDDDKWEKDKDKTKIKEALKALNKNHFRLIKQWLDSNPDYMEDDNKQAYFAKILKTCGAILDDEKIIKKICTSNYIKNHVKDLDENLIE
jgi:flagellar motility protein MotE (MotC chaperone)